MAVAELSFATKKHPVPWRAEMLLQHPGRDSPCCGQWQWRRTSPSPRFHRHWLRPIAERFQAIADALDGIKSIGVDFFEGGGAIRLNQQQTRCVAEIRSLQSSITIGKNQRLDDPARFES